MFELEQEVYVVYEEKDDSGQYKWRLKKQKIMARTIEEAVGKETAVHYEARGFWFLQDEDIFATREEAEAAKKERNGVLRQKVREDLEYEIVQAERHLATLRDELQARSG